MTEITTTRMNHLVDPDLHVWAWQIPAYLFLGGLVAGMMIVAGWILLSRPRGVARSRSVIFLLPGLAIVLLSLGMFALFLDLEHKPYVWRLYTTFQWTSPMSWGAWILVAVYPVLMATLALRPPEWVTERVPAVQPLADRLIQRGALARGIGWANVVLGAMLGVYTGILLSTLGARPAWNSALLGPLFLASGLSSAAALVHLLARRRDERETLARADSHFLKVELVLLALFLIGLASSSRAHASAAALFLGGPFTATFWAGVVGAGILVPLVIQTLAVPHRVKHTLVAPLLVIAGGLLLRIVLVSAGQASHWRPF
jgi:formate-dependent nitrite reductase membrane component NrfD